MEWDFNVGTADVAQPSYEEDLAGATEFTEVEKRLAKAECYKAFLGDSLFGDSPSGIEQEVESEFREWAMGRLNNLMGMGPNVQQLTEVFDDEGIAILVGLVKTIKEKNALKGVVVKPVVQKPTTPKPRKPGRLQKPVVQPRIETPVQTRPTQKPVIQPKPQAKVQNDGAPQWIENIPGDGQTVTKSGKKFQIRHVAMVGSDEFYENPAIGDFITQIPEGKAIRVPNINIVVWNNAGVYTKLIESPLDERPDAAAHGGIKMPSAKEMEYISADMAAKATRMAPANFRNVIHLNESERT